jgi:hypothetical protein
MCHNVWQWYIHTVNLLNVYLKYDVTYCSILATECTASYTHYRSTFVILEQYCRPTQSSSFDIPKIKIHAYLSVMCNGKHVENNI